VSDDSRYAVVDYYIEKMEGLGLDPERIQAIADEMKKRIDELEDEIRREYDEEVTSWIARLR
jgi:hypothetical protein